MAGFRRQSIGLGLEVNLNYDILCGRRFVLGMGVGYRSHDRRYTVTDSAAVHNPENQIESYRYVTRIIEMPIYFKVKVLKQFCAGLRVQLPLVSSEGLISAKENSSISYFGKWGLPDFGDIQTEVFFSYSFSVKGMIIAPTISVGTPIYPSTIRFRPYSDFGVRVNYQKR